MHVSVACSNTHSLLMHTILFLQRGRLRGIATLGNCDNLWVQSWLDTCVCGQTGAVSTAVQGILASFAISYTPRGVAPELCTGVLSTSILKLSTFQQPCILNLCNV